MISSLCFVILCFVLLVAQGYGKNIHTPHGIFHEDCVVQVPSGSAIKSMHINGVEHGHITHPNGTTRLVPPCPHNTTKAKRDDYSWNGWAEHLWYGNHYAPFTNPPSLSPITSFQATWNVPNYPASVNPAPGSPWGNDYVGYWWPGLQPMASDGPVLQPVLGLESNTFFVNSWACCISGTIFSSPTINVNPGQTLNGSMELVSPYVYNITTEVVGGGSTTLISDLSSEQYTFPWALTIFESYYISTCNQIPTEPVTFTVTKFETQAVSGYSSSDPFAGVYYIGNVQNGLALDANTGAAAQYDSSHPRPFLWSNPNPAVNHFWDIEPSPNPGFYTIRSLSSNLCLDGNTDLSNYNTAHPVPFMWPCVPSALNHQWQFVFNSTANAYTIFNNWSGQVLDGNAGVQNFDPDYPNPFMWDNYPGFPNQQWFLGTMNANTLPWNIGYSCDSTACQDTIGPSCQAFTSYYQNDVTIGFN